ncbi:hypothetical protein ACIQ7N_13630 [Lysinibacillus sp. NPDC095746]|uniref:hypothetical protein n=1 Tax=Lysinibacillus sp. NPDC095746 TaxID=3364134 RepID=UPI00380BF9C6
MNDYIKMMRQMIGHETLLAIGCGAIIEDDRGRILLQRLFSQRLLLLKNKKADLISKRVE